MFDEHDLEHDVTGSSSTACLVSLESSSSASTSNNKNKLGTSYQDPNGPNASSRLTNTNSKVPTEMDIEFVASDHHDENSHKAANAVKGVLKNSAGVAGETTTNYIKTTEDPTSSPTLSSLSKAGKRSVGNLTVTFDFDFEDRSIGNEVEDTPRKHIFKEVPSFLQKNVIGPVVDIVTAKRKQVGGRKSHLGNEPLPKHSVTHPKYARSMTKGTDVIRKKSLAPQPPVVTKQTNFS